MSALRPSVSINDNPLCSDWFEFRDDGTVVLKTAKVEIGQGITTALVQIAADELDIAPERFEVISGHTGLVPVEGATSSSLSVEVTGSAIRLAASAVRHRLVAEAGKLLQADPARLSLVDGKIMIESRETPLTLWSVAKTVDLATPVMDDAAPKAIGDRRLVGISLPRRDLREKAVGGNTFIHDIVLDGMKHGRVLQPPAPERGLASFDVEGFKASFPDVTLVRSGSFVGVIADREDVAARAIAGAERFAIWDAAGAYPSDVIAMLSETDAPEFVVKEEGDPSACAGRRVEATITKPYTAHASIAPSCAIAAWTGDTLTVHSHTQAPHGLCDGMAIVFGIDAGAIKVIHTPGAGTYGHSGQDDVALEAAVLARAVPGVPVRVVWSRADEFIAGPLGPAMVVRAAATLDDAGHISALEVSSMSQPHARRPGRGGYAELTPAARLDPPLPVMVPDDVPPARGGGADRNATPLYTIPNLRITKRIVKASPYRTSALRGLGAYANVYAVETLIDELAEQAGQDPIAFRLAHLDDARAKAVISRAAEMAGWPGPSGEGEGIGIGFAQYKNRSAYSAVAMRVRLDEDVRLVGAWAVCDAGEAINPDGIVNQIEGSIIQAASWTLKETIALAEDTVATRSWGDYPILTFPEIPPITVEVIDLKDQPWLGVGETAVGPTGAAIGNAVARAIGVRVRNLPITRDAIAAAPG
jgi:nicotinate dehydrogenase subunit B